ncbi:MAG: hypothetical protein ACRCTY_10850 [Candidatus Adiutrix sp.]
MRILICVFGVLAGLMVFGCASKPSPQPPQIPSPPVDAPVPSDPFGHVEVRKSRWAATLFLNETESTEAQVIVITALDFDRRARVLVFSPLGVALGDCFVGDDGGRVCDGASGAWLMVDRISSAVRAMVLANAPFMQTTRHLGATVVGANWEASKDELGNIEYRRLSEPNWAIFFAVQ